MQGSRFAVRIAAAALASLLGWGACPATAATGPETSCVSKLGKGVAKLGKTVLKEHAKCRDADLAGSAVGACPAAGNLEKIQKVADKLAATAQAVCKSTCSVSSTVECIASAHCPPVIVSGNYAPQNCTSSKGGFNIRNIGFPGPNCPTDMIRPQDIGVCAADVAVPAAEALVDAVYGSLTNASMPSAEARNCLKAIMKSATKLAGTVTKGVAKCRDLTLRGKRTGDPAACQTTDLKLAAKIAKAEAKLDASMDASCQSGLSSLDLCGNGIGATNLADAKACVKAAAREVADSPVVPALRTFSPVSMIEAAYPPAPRCGDNKVNQIPNALLLLGEECDGSDDAACPGACLPSGDVFECTCGDKKRLRLFADAALTDADAGWTGNSHEQGVADLSGYVVELSNCDCDDFDGPTCIGSSGDPVCDVQGRQQPSCSWEPFSGTTCDVRGNLDGTDENKDCFVCDGFSANEGDFCRDEEDCDAQCHDADGNVTGPCEVQADCAAGEVCRGQCDRSQTCVIIPNGAPLPVSSTGSAVCAVQRFRGDVTGTRDMITGEHDYFWQLYSIIHLGETTVRPCPVCGGFCEGGTNDLRVCEGRCTVSADPCRFDVDCPPGETCSSLTPDCPGANAFCQLESVCGTSRSENALVYNKPCTIEYAHPVFGTPSNDCLPAPAKNITGKGFEINYMPATSGAVTLPALFPCTAAGFELFDCPCPGVGGAPTKPNNCAPACNAAGANFGVGCATGVGSGQGTTCAGGANVGKLCDEDADCPTSSCSANPTHCFGDPSFERFPCATNADCGLGTCEDACPGGRCVPLCVPDPLDTDDGICAGGLPVSQCEGDFKFKTCTLASATSGSCSATCSISATPCVKQSDCPSGESCSGPCDKAKDCEAGADGVIGSGDDNRGYGECVIGERNCYLEPVAGEGGSTLNGQGDPENDNQAGVYCYTATTNPAVNAAAGFPGPGRVLQRGINVSNGFASIP